MRQTLYAVCFFCLSAFLSGCGNTSDDHTMNESSNGEPVNYLVYSPRFSSAGMPDAEFISRLGSEGVNLVINIAPHSASGALDNEAKFVADAGMTYLNIPVDWNKPTQEDVDRFLDTMQSNPGANVFLHCQMNMRATAFAMLHRVINLEVDPDVALADMHTIWKPNATWAELMNTAFDKHKIDYAVTAPKK